MADKWCTLREWPELILEQLEDAGVARVILDRPAKRNCLNEPLVAAWFEALDIVRADRDIKVVITKGAGICFSSGLDLHFLRKVSEEPHDWIARRRRCRWPKRCVAFRASSLPKCTAIASAARSAS
jgi:enoyl-CoA hydratase/carnithine racemase